MSVSAMGERERTGGKHAFRPGKLSLLFKIYFIPHPQKRLRTCLTSSSSAFAAGT